MIHTTIQMAIKSWAGSALKLIRRKKVSFRLGFGFILMTIIPVLTIGCFAYISGTHALYSKTSDSVAQIINQLSVNLSYQLQSIINDGTEIAYSDTVQSALSNYEQLNSQEINKIQTTLSDNINKKYVFNNRVSEITLYTTNLDTIKAYGPSDFRFIPKKEYLQRWIKEADKNDGKCLWIAAGPEVEEGLASKINKDRKSIVMVRSVKSLTDGSCIGYILLRIDAEQFYSIYGNIKINPGIQMLILNSENKVISTTDNYGKFSKPYPATELLENIKNSKQKTFNTTLDGNRCLIAFNTLKQADWYVVAVVHFSYLYSESNELLRDVLVITLLALLFGFCVNVIIYWSIMTPVRQLVHGINSFKNGNLEISVDDNGSDELSELNRDFNEMIVNTNQLIANIKENEKQKRDLEIRALQAQINPHFFANALNMVSYVASLKKEENIVQMIKSILALLNGCMKNDNSLITVKEEIVFLENYFSLQKARLLGSFSVQYDVDPEIMNYLIPRFLLQPVVENALIHGIEPSGKAGIIVIKGTCSAGKLHFSVTDNGVGMDQDQINGLLSKNNTNEKGRLSGIGIANVSQRINLLYGPEYGLRINSVKGVFTTVDIYLPLTPNDGIAD
jgi:two-component system sensor histidine kinase YesM